MNPKCQKRTFKRGESSRDTWTGRVKDTVEATVPDRVRGNYSTSARSCQTRRCARVGGRVGSRSRRDSKATAPGREFPTRAPPQKASSGEVCKISNDKTHMKTRERDRIAQRIKTQRNDFDASWKRKIGMMLMKRKKCQEINTPKTTWKLHCTHQNSSGSDITEKTTEGEKFTENVKIYLRAQRVRAN